MRSLLFTCVAALSMCLAAPVAQAQETVKIGVMVPLTGGNFSVVGEDMRRGFAMAVDEVNARGGLGGKKVEMIVGDDQANPTVGIGVAQKLYVRDNVAAIVGIYSSTVAKAVAAAVGQYKKPLFIAGASASIVEDAVGHEPWYFHFYPYAYYIATTLVDFFKTLDPVPKTVAIAFENGVYGTSNTKLLKEQLEPAGFKIVAEESFKTGSPSMLPLIARLKAAEPDVVIVQAYVSDNILFTKQFKEANFSPRLIVMPEIFSQEFYPAVGKSGEGLTGYTTWIPESTYAENQRWLRDFRSRYPERTEPQDWAPIAYTSMKMVLNSIRDVGTDPAKLIARLEQETTDSPFGRVKFSQSKNGHHQVLTNMQIVQYQDGKKVIVYPKEQASAKVRYPVK
jgi:branched-chain amino acid transport system substrate-binding protein